MRRFRNKRGQKMRQEGEEKEEGITRKEGRRKMTRGKERRKETGEGRKERKKE